METMSKAEITQILIDTVTRVEMLEKRINEGPKRPKLSLSMADQLLSCINDLEVSKQWTSLHRLREEMGYTAKELRNAVTRLQKKHYVKQRMNKQTWVVTALGRRYLVAIKAEC